MLDSLVLQSQFSFFINLIIRGLYLGGFIGVMVGAIAWTATEKGNRTLGFLMAGGLFGLILGFIVSGTNIINMFGSTEAILMNADQASSQTFRAILQIVSFTLTGMAIGGAASAFGRAISGAFIGLVAGTVAGMILFLLNAQMGLPISGPVASILIGFMTLILVAIMSIGQAT